MTGTKADAGGFLQRWSRRKLQARTGVQPEMPDVPPRDSPVQEENERNAVEEPVLTDADMPPLESLDAESDYSGFLSPGVSEDLRTQALSKLFHSPACNLIDDLDDYAEDFTRFAALGDVITADMRHRIEQEAERLLDADAEKIASPAEENHGAASHTQEDTRMGAEDTGSVGRNSDSVMRREQPPDDAI